MADTKPTKDQIKEVRKSIRDFCKKDKNKTERWMDTEKYYGKNPNKTNTTIGKNAVHHILNSNGIRKMLCKHTPKQYPSIIPENCTLSFWFPDGLNMNGHKLFDGFGD